MKLTKKKFCLLLTLCLLFCVSLTTVITIWQVNLQGTMYKPNDYQTYSVHAESTLYSLKHDDSFSLRYYDFFDKDITSYNKGIAALCFYSSMEMQNEGKVVISGKADHEETNNIQFFKDLGCYAVEEYALYDQYTVDPNDTTRIVVALFEDTIKQKYVVLTSISGTRETSEWVSNFDIGANNDEYYNATGAHPEWLFKDNHKGYDVTAKRVNDKVKLFLTKYIKKLNNAQGVTYCFTGYSRGASLANVCAQQLIDTPANRINPSAKVMAYTFATPPTTTSSNCKNVTYNSIFNHQAVADPMMQLPPTNLGFKTYGVDISLDLSKVEGGYDAFYKMTKSNYDKNDSASGLFATLNSVSESREKVYKVLKDQDCVMTLTGTSYNDVMVKKAVLQIKTDVMHVSSYVEYDNAVQNPQTGAYEIKYRFAFAVFTVVLPTLLTNPTIEGLNSMEIFICQRLSSLKNNLVYTGLSGVLKNNHLPGSYIIMLDDYWAKN